MRRFFRFVVAAVVALAALALWSHLQDDPEAPAEARNGPRPVVPPAAASRVHYPPSPRVDVIDDYHGTPVADPWRWLEDTDSARTAEWVSAQNAVSSAALAALPDRQAYLDRLTGLWNYERIELPFRKAGRLFWRRNDGLQNQSVLYVQDGGAQGRVLLDPNTLSADGTVAVSLVEISPDGEWLAYGLQAAGSDWTEFRVRSVDTGEDLPDRLVRSKFADVAWTDDSAGLFYARYPDPPAGAGDTFDDLANQKLYYHRLKTDPATDVLVYERPDDPQLHFSPEVTDDGRHLVILVTKGTSYNLVYLKSLGDPKKPTFDAPVQPVVEAFEADYVPVGSTADTLLVLTNKDAPRKRIIGIDFAAPQAARWRTVVPEGADTLDTAIHAGGELVVLAMQDATHRLRRYGLDGKTRGEIAMPGLGSVPETHYIKNLSGEAGSPEIFYGYASFNQPMSQYRYDLATGETTLHFSPKLNFDGTQFTTEQVFYTSKDGTRVPMFISYRKGLQRDGSNPAWLYGYGGFDNAMLPSFSVPVLAWMERGGVYAMANLRGGGEYGEAWHLAGTKERKQNVFDDFAAAAQFLAAQKWTSAQHLAMSGRSNGGLLVGAVLNQHPELFAAAVPQVGVMDMLRFHKFTIGWAWTSDYGSSDDADGFRYLHAYSPYHNVKPGTRYPAVLVTTADHDDRVVPGHSFKYTAAMQAAQAGEAPVLIRIDVKAGHGGGKPVTKLIEEWGDVLAFMSRYTGGVAAATATPVAPASTAATAGD